MLRFYQLFDASSTPCSGLQVNALFTIDCYRRNLVANY